MPLKNKTRLRHRMNSKAFQSKCACHQIVKPKLLFYECLCGLCWTETLDGQQVYEQEGYDE